jgi:hypothetical protein
LTSDEIVIPAALLACPEKWFLAFAQVEALARDIVGTDTDTELQKLARRMASADFFRSITSDS